MGRQYRHLTLAEREDIMVAWANHVGVGEIARLVGRDKSTVSREIRPNGWYSPVAGRMRCYRTRAPPTTRASAGRGGAAASPCWPIPGAWSWWPG